MTSHRHILNILAILTSVVLGSCGSVVGRFMARSVERINDPIVAPPMLNTHPILASDSAALSVLWVGHATTVIQIYDKVIVTDPAFFKTIGMVAKRSVRAGVDPSAITTVHATIISHIHFDHFNYGSLDVLPKGGLLLLPQGGLEYTPEFGFRDTRELRAWERAEVDSLRITAVPVKHFAGRYGFDAVWMPNEGFTGYIIEYRGVTVFFGGDQGYHPEIYKEIGLRYPNIDLALLPIAPVEPREFMKRVHTDPAEALQVFSDVGARWMIPIHHRTFIQGLETDVIMPQQELEALASKAGLQERVKILQIGEQRILK